MLKRLENCILEASKQYGIFKKKQIADFLGLSYQYYVGITTGKEKISESFLKLLSEKFNINPNYITGNDNEMFLPRYNNYQNVNGNNNHVIGSNNNITEAESNTKHIIGCKEGKIIECDLNAINNISLEEYCLGEPLKEDPSSLIPNCTFAYQICSRELEPYLLQGDWICIKKVSFNEVRHQGVYLVDTVNDGKMIKRISLLDDGDYMLSLPIPNTNYPIITRKKEEIYDFYELVSRIQNSPSIIFNQPSIIKEMIKNNTEILKFSNQILENNTIMLRNIQITLDNHKKTLDLLELAIKNNNK